MNHVQQNLLQYSNVSEIVCVNHARLPALRRRFQREAYRCFDLHSPNVIRADSLVHELVTKIPCDPPYYDYHGKREVNWDALSDCLSGGLVGSGGNVALMWHESNSLVENHLNLIFMAASILFFIGKNTPLEGHRFGVKFILLGDGPNFE